MKAKVILFKDTGKYYTEEEWEIPSDALGPYDMEKSKDFHRIDNGAVLVDTQEPWGYPHLFPNEERKFNFELIQDGYDGMWIAKAKGMSIRHANKAHVMALMTTYLDEDNGFLR